MLDVDDEDLSRISNWDNSWKDEKLSKVNTKWPKKLLGSLLQKIHRIDRRAGAA